MTQTSYNVTFNIPIRARKPVEAAIDAMHLIWHSIAMYDDTFAAVVKAEGVEDVEVRDVMRIRYPAHSMNRRQPSDCCARVKAQFGVPPFGYVVQIDRNVRANSVNDAVLEALYRIEANPDDLHACKVVSSCGAVNVIKSPICSTPSRWLELTRNRDGGVEAWPPRAQAREVYAAQELERMAQAPRPRLRLRDEIELQLRPRFDLDINNPAPWPNVPPGPLNDAELNRMLDNAIHLVANAPILHLGVDANPVNAERNRLVERQHREVVNNRYDDDDDDEF